MKIRFSDGSEAHIRLFYAYSGEDQRDIRALIDLRKNIR